MLDMRAFKVGLKWFGLTVVVSVVAACAGNDKLKMADLVTNPASLGVKTSWTASIGNVDFPLEIKVHGTTLYLAGTDGNVAAIDGRTGGDIWRSKINEQLTAGVGSDGRFSAVINRNNELITLDAGREIWRHKLGATSLTAPLIAGDRIFVLAGDRSVNAFDAVSGRKLWQQQRPGEALILQQSGVILAVGDTLVVGLGGRLVGINPQSGSIRWETLVANSRGTNEVERLVDLVAGVSRSGSQVCVRSFQSAVACIDGVKGTTVWTKMSVGSAGIGGDANLVFGVTSDSKLVAWRRSDGDTLWTNEDFKNRMLTTPLHIGSSIVVGDGNGYVHFLSHTNGNTLNRISTDGTAIVAGPVQVGQSVVVVTRRGGVFSFKPE
jgi:outer membrane protein assembly factor BamB